MEIIKTTKYDYSCLVIHHPEEGFLFLGRAQKRQFRIQGYLSGNAHQFRRMF